MKKTTVCIVGAGPAGSIAALFLAKNGINCTLVDRAKFPRDKICGDGISGWVVTVLNILDKDLLHRLAKSPFLLHSHGIRIVAPNTNSIDLPFLNNDQFDDNIPPGFIGRRVDFDNFLIKEVKRMKEIQLLEETEITGYKRENNQLILYTQNEEELSSSLVIFANGANSVFMKDPGGIIKSKKHTMTGIKAYYDGITGFHNQNYVELHFLKNLIPGYFWIFPLPDGLANVGVGLDQKRISDKKINLKEVMLKAIETIPYLQERFQKASMVTKIQAYGLPLWDGKRKISGDNFMLAGDAANLIDPVTGEGMGHAAISGMLAAEQVLRCVDKNDFSAGFMNQFDQRVYDKIGKELKISSKIIRFLKYPSLFNMMVNKAAGSKILQKNLSLAMTDMKMRKQLINPYLYLKIMLGR